MHLFPENGLLKICQQILDHSCGEHTRGKSAQCKSWRQRIYIEHFSTGISADNFQPEYRLTGWSQKICWPILSMKLSQQYSSPSESSWRELSATYCPVGLWHPICPLILSPARCRKGSSFPFCLVSWETIVLLVAHLVYCALFTTFLCEVLNSG